MRLIQAKAVATYKGWMLSVLAAAVPYPWDSIENDTREKVVNHVPIAASVGPWSGLIMTIAVPCEPQTQHQARTEANSRSVNRCPWKPSPSRQLTNCLSVYGIPPNQLCTDQHSVHGELTDLTGGRARNRNQSDRAKSYAERGTPLAEHDSQSKFGGSLAKAVPYWEFW